MIHRQASCSDSHESGLMPVKDALARILSDIRVISGHEYVGIETALRRTLYEPVTAPIDVPMHANSAVDGYAVRSADLNEQIDCRLEIAGYDTSAVNAGEWIKVQPFSGLF